MRYINPRFLLFLLTYKTTDSKNRVICLLAFDMDIPNKVDGVRCTDDVIKTVISKDDGDDELMEQKIVNQGTRRLYDQ